MTDFIVVALSPFGLWKVLELLDDFLCWIFWGKK
jgi:hypothetical protein